MAIGRRTIPAVVLPLAARAIAAPLCAPPACVAESDEPVADEVGRDDTSLDTGNGLDAGLPGDAMTECCPIEPRQQFCTGVVWLGGSPASDGQCPGYVDDGAGPPREFWEIAVDPFGCPIWQLVDPATPPGCSSADAGTGTQDAALSDAGPSAEDVREPDDGPGDVSPDTPATDAMPDDAAEPRELDAGSGEALDVSDTSDGSGGSDAVDGSGAGSDSAGEE
jgi:hypothetical protein